MVYPWLTFPNGSPKPIYVREANVSAFMNFNITKQDSIIFYKKVYPKLSNLFYVDSDVCSKRAYKSYYHGTLLLGIRKVAECSTRFIQFNLINKQTNSPGTKILYFIDGVIENAVVPNDSISMNYQDDLIQVDLCIACDSSYKTIIAAHDNEYAWNYIKSDEQYNQKRATKWMERYLKELVVDYHYYYDLPILKIKNPAFWDSIFHSIYNKYDNEIIYPLEIASSTKFKGYMINVDSSHSLELTPPAKVK